MFGPIKKIIMINDSDTGKPKGYAFIEYEHERDMHGKSCNSFILKKPKIRIWKNENVGAAKNKIKGVEGEVDGSEN